LNPEQAEACHTPINTPLQVLAGAGTGKTMLITARYLTLLDALRRQGKPHAESRILVMTFTKKAAGEMKGRIHEHLKKAGYTGALPDENITTFNSFGQGFLMRHAVEAGLNDGITVLDENEQQALKTQITQRILKGQAHLIQSTLERYRLYEARAEANGDAIGIPKDVLSPKRMAERGLKKDPDAFLENVWQVVGKVKSYGLTPHAFRELARQQCLAFSESLKRLPAETYMTTVQDLYDAWRKPLQAFSSSAWEFDFLSLDDYASQKEAYKACLDPKVFKMHPALQIKRLPKIDGILPPDAVDWSALTAQTQRELDWIDVITAVYALYQERLFLDAVIDYDDQINLTLQTLQKHPALRQKYQNWFDAIMVDEFQDTNGSQLALLKCLMRHPENGWNDVDNQCNLTIVGDVKQSIYSFRFAQKENVSLVFEGVSPKKVSLISNYRCRAGILHVANQVADATAENPAERDAHLVACKASDEKAPTEATAYYFGTQTDETKWEDSKSLRLEHAVQTLVKNLLTDYHTHQNQEKIASPDEASLFAWRDYCVLGRSHQQLQSVAHYLEAKRIPYVMERDGKLFKLPIIQVASAFLQVLHQPEDTTAWVGLFQNLLPPLRLLHAVEAVHLKQKQF
jgi:superfamily I DNA/RNA helicase